MKKTNDILLSLTLIPLTIVATIFITIPIVKSIWNMLVYPTYHVNLESGVIIFVIMTKTIFSHKHDTKETADFYTNCTKVTSFYFTLLFIWAMAKMYTFFI